MADSTLNAFDAKGTTAERMAFTPSPPTPATGPDSGYVWFDTDLVALYCWDGAAWQPASAGTGTVTHTGSLTSGQLVLGNGTADVAVGNLSGDISTSGSAVTAIGANKVTNAQLRTSTALTVVGRSANSTGNVADIAASAASDAVLRESGSVLGFGTIATAGIANSAVTLAKIANASASSKLVGSGASGSGAAYSELTLGTNLSMSGTTLNAAGGSAGALILLEQHTASSSSTLDFTTFISSTYDTYIIEGVDLISATNAVSLLMRVGTGGGPTYDTGSNYYWSRNYQQVGTQFALAGSVGVTADTSVTIVVLQSSTKPTAFTIRLKSPQNSSYAKLFEIEAIQVASDGNVYKNFGGSAFYNAVTALTALRFLMSSGNIASGTIRTYGVAK